MEHLAGLDAILAGHCPLTGRYFEPCKATPIQVNTLGSVTAWKGGNDYTFKGLQSGNLQQKIP